MVRNNDISYFKWFHNCFGKRKNLENQRSYKSNLYAFIIPYQFVEKLKDCPCCRWKKPHFHNKNQIVNKVGKYVTWGFSPPNRWRGLWKHYGSNSSVMGWSWIWKPCKWTVIPKASYRMIWLTHQPKLVPIFSFNKRDLNFSSTSKHLK